MEDEDWVLVQHPDQTSMDSFLIGDSAPLKVVFGGPAKYWTDAIPVGNGRLGAMVWGGVASEIIQLNEDTLWTGMPGNYTNPEIPGALPQVRKLVDNDQFYEATQASSKLFGGYTEVYQLIGDIKLDFDDFTPTDFEGTYDRELDLNTATALVKYAVNDVEFVREHFASYPDQVIVTNISGSKPGAVSFTVSLDSQLDHRSFVNGITQIIMEGSCPAKRIPLEDSVNDDSKGIQFSAILEVRTSNGAGIHIFDNNKLKVEGSDWATLLLVASSAFEGPFITPSESKKDPTAESLLALKAVENLSYSDLYARHLVDYQNLFNRVSLQLSKSPQGNVEGELVPTVERIKSFQTNEDPTLVELLFQFGRYLLISSSRPGTQPANLQGIWNKDLAPSWEAAPHLNINLQMNYWPSLPSNLSECQEPLYEYIKSLSINGSKTAKVNYQASGWVTHHVSDIWAKSDAFTKNAKYAIWPMGGAWLCTHLWEQYCFTMDKEFLEKKAYPLLEGCTSFLLDWLIEGHEGYLETNPSTSPEHEFVAPDGKRASVSYSSTMDMAIIKEVFSSILAASEVLGRTEDVTVQKVLKANLRLPPMRIARDGSVMEWAQDFEDPEVRHRHLSHLFGLFPGHSISLERNPDLCKAVENSLYKRGEDGPGWSTTWKTALWARLHNTERAYTMVKHLFKLADPEQGIPFKGGLYSSLFAAHPPFQIDANFGFTAAVAEMLVQSSLKDLYILPALPRDKWPNGSINGLKARGGLTTNIRWKEGDLHGLDLWLNDNNTTLHHRLHYKGIKVDKSISSGIVYTFNKQLNCVKTCLISELAVPI